MEKNGNQQYQLLQRDFCLRMKMDFRYQFQTVEARFKKLGTEEMKMALIISISKGLWNEQNKYNHRKSIRASLTNWEYECWKMKKSSIRWFIEYYIIILPDCILKTVPLCLVWPVIDLKIFLYEQYEVHGVFKLILFYS